MPKLDQKVWWGLKRDFQNYALGITEKTITIVDIPRSEGQLGYTAKGKGIHLANDHPLMDSMTTKEKISFITGVFAHELMHKIATHFQELEKVRDSIPSKYEAEIFWEIANVVEDPSIEAQAKCYFGGWLLKCLHRSIMVLFKESPPMGESPMHPFSQFITALIMYGDGGEVKGDFQDLKARLVFKRVLPLVDQCIDERDSKKRVKLQYEIFLMAKPLWKDIVKNREEMDKLMQELAKIMKNCGKDTKGSGESPMGVEGDDSTEDPAAEKKKKRRKITFRKVSKEELDSIRKLGSSDDDSNIEDESDEVEILYCEENDEPSEEPKTGSGKTQTLTLNDTGDGESDVPKSSGSNESSSEAPEDQCDGDNKESDANTTEGDTDASGASGARASAESDKSESCDDSASGASENDSESDEKGSPTSTASINETSTENKGKPDASGEEGSGAEDEGIETKDDVNGDTDKELPLGRDGEKKDESNSCQNGDTNMSQPADGTDGDYSEPDYEKEAAIDETEYELSESDLGRITEMINDYQAEFDRRENERTDCYSEDLNVPSLAADYSGVRCLNKRISCSNSESLEISYARLTDSIADGINFLFNQMKRIINNDAAEREYRGTGKLNVGRLNCGRMTSRVFDRNIDPANKADMCVEILVDESGSMSSGRNWQCAMMCCIGLAEVLAKLHIPTKVIGFTADHDGSYDVTHHHYMHWLNTKAERMNLMNINAHSNNFDGYSIRYATEMIKRRKEQHKILIIISDGAPACNYYYRKNGIIDTTDAVKQAAKKVDVIGVGIGGRDTSIWRAMYGSAFIHVKDAKDLLTNIGKEIQNIMRRW